jgi:uncharacterized protein (DUF924 family)
MSTETQRSSSDTSEETCRAVLNFWFDDGLEKGWPTKDMQPLWFGAKAQLDELIRERFMEPVCEALAGGFEDWEDEPDSRLALVVLLDQFTRNAFRGEARAFAGDQRAQQLVKDALAKNWDDGMAWVARMSMYMPLMHAEDLDLQDECIARFTRLLADVPDKLKETIEGNLKYARKHHDIVAEFGRFPYRNATLGRLSTPAEQVFIISGPRFGQ